MKPFQRTRTFLLQPKHSIYNIFCNIQDLQLELIQQQDPGDPMPIMSSQHYYYSFTTWGLEKSKPGWWSMDATPYSI